MNHGGNRMNEHKMQQMLVNLNDDITSNIGNGLCISLTQVVISPYRYCSTVKANHNTVAKSIPKTSS